MARNIFITGTGTEVGKTYTTALIAKHLVEQGYKVAYYKAAVSGNVRGPEGLVPGDAVYVKEIAGLEQSIDSMVPYIYEQAFSPHLASRLEGNPVELEWVKKGFLQLQKTYDYVIMEGSGGILCPIRFDGKEIWLEDIIKELSLPSFVVADAGLGTINYAGLTVAYMKQKQLSIRGIIVNRYLPGDTMQEDNIKMIEHVTKLPVVAVIQEGAGDIILRVNNLEQFI